VFRVLTPFSDRFLKRWNIELDLRSIKIVLQMDVLRCKSPDLVDKEIWVHMLAYNIIRGLMATAAAKSGAAPRELGFKMGLWPPVAARSLSVFYEPADIKRRFVRKTEAAIATL
jgi:hypothetical protein